MGDEIKNDVEEMNKMFDGIGETIADKKEEEDKDLDKDIDQDKDVDKDVEDKDLDKDVDDDKDVDKDLDKDVDVDLDKDKDKDKDDEPDEKDTIIDDLRIKLADAEANRKIKDKEVDDKDKDTDKDKEDKEVPLTLDEQDFIGELDLEEVVRDPKEFNKLLNKIYAQAVTDTRKVLGEGVLRSIPDIVKTNIVLQTQLKKASDDFYDANKDLKPFNKVVALVFEEMYSKNPDKKYDELMNEVSGEVRSRLNLQKQATEKEDKDGKDKDEKHPKLPRKKGRSGAPEDKPETNGLQDEIASMNKVVA